MKYTFFWNDQICEKNAILITPLKTIWTVYISEVW